MCLRALDTNSLCAKDVRRNGDKDDISGLHMGEAGADDPEYPVEEVCHALMD